MDHTIVVVVKTRLRISMERKFENKRRQTHKKKKKKVNEYKIYWYCNHLTQHCFDKRNERYYYDMLYKSEWTKRVKCSSSEN